MAPRPPRRIGADIIIPFLLVALVFGGLLWQKYHEAKIMPNTPPCKQGEAQLKKIILFFADDHNKLHREAREVDSCESKDACLRTIVDELSKGPISELFPVLPDATVLRSVTIQRKTAILDFEDSFSENVAAGSAAEMTAVYALTNTICTNMPDIKQVRIMIMGSSTSKLRHLDLRDPFKPNYTLVGPDLP